MPIEPEGRRAFVRLILYWVLVIFVAVVTTGNLYLVLQVRRNAEIGNKTACVIVLTLEGSIERNKQLIHNNPGDPDNKQRRDSVVQTTRLVKDLRSTGIDCARIHLGGE